MTRIACNCGYVGTCYRDEYDVVRCPRCDTSVLPGEEKRTPVPKAFIKAFSEVKE